MCKWQWVIGLGEKLSGESREMLMFKRKSLSSIKYYWNKIIGVPDWSIDKMRVFQTIVMRQRL